MTAPVISWKKGVSGNWAAASDWSSATVPGAADQASLSAIGTYTVTSSANINVYSLTTAAGATLDIAGNFAAFAGTGAGVTAGKINVDAGASFEVGNTLASSTLDNIGTIRPSSGGALIMDGAVTLTGAGKVALSGGAIAGDATNGGTLSNHGNTILGSGWIGNGDGKLTFDNVTGTVDAVGPETLASALGIDTGNTALNTGVMEATAGGYLLIDDDLINYSVSKTGIVTNGVIESTGASTTHVGSIVDLSGGSIDGGTVIIGNGTALSADGGPSHPSTIGEITASHSVVTDAGTLLATNDTSLTLLDTTINAAGGVIKASDSSTILLDGATINGGTLTTLNGGTIETVPGYLAHLSGVTISAGSTVTVADDQSSGYNPGYNPVDGLVLQSTITNHGTIALDATADFANLGISGNVTLAGGGHVTLSDNANNNIYGISSSATNVTLTNVDNTISGAGTISSEISSYANGLNLNNEVKGIIDANGVNPLVIYNDHQLFNGTPLGLLTNAGTLEATNTGGLLIGHSVVVNNTGTIKSDGGPVTIELFTESFTQPGTSTTAYAVNNSGTIEALNGSVTIGSVNNSGKIIADGGNVVLDGALAGTGQVEIFAGSSVTLGGSATNSVTFEPGGNSSLILHTAQGLFGNVSGLVSGDTIDFTNFASATTKITHITNYGGGAVGSITNVTLTDSESQLSETLHLVNTTAHEYSTSASDYSLTPDAHATIVGTAFHLHV